LIGNKTFQLVEAVAVKGGRGEVERGRRRGYRRQDGNRRRRCVRDGGRRREKE